MKHLYVLLLLSLSGCGADPNDPMPVPPPPLQAGSVVLVGDSRMAYDPIQALCEKPVYDMGILGIRTAGLMQRLPWAELTDKPPALFILAVGINDTWRANETSLETWQESMLELHAALSAIAPVVTATIVLSEPIGQYATSFDNAMATTMNTVLLAQPWSKIDLEALAAEGRGQGLFLTVDGVHYTPSFYQDIHRAYATACGLL